VDVTAGGAADKINPAIEKVTRFVNIYAGAGKHPATVRITVILHGKATAAALHDDAYAAKFQTVRNPNIPLFVKLKAAGVEVLVCGQSLVHAGHQHEDVAREVGVAVSALTVNVNRQADGYAFIPLH
jgi:intracellular sulfur oxidation DsrE/DsrF family protein